MVMEVVKKIMINTFISNIITIFTSYFQNTINIVGTFLGGLIVAIVGACLIFILVKFFMTKGGL